MTMNESRLNVSSLRKLLYEAGFKGSVAALSSLGPIPNREFLCAVLYCAPGAPHKAYINTNIDCSHEHLTSDVMKLVAAFESGKLDRGWTVKSNGEASTGISTRQNVARAGIPPSHWAPSPT